MGKFANTEVRIPLYDRSWDGLEDVVSTLAHIALEIRSETPEQRERADGIFIEIEWEEEARNDAAFMARLEQYVPAQFWLRFERR